VFDQLSKLRGDRHDFPCERPYRADHVPLAEEELAVFRVSIGPLREVTFQRSLVPAALGLPAVLFYASTNLLFAIDDFALLRNARDQVNTLANWVDVFTQMNGSGMYRPLTKQLYFWVCWQLFGFHTVPYFVINGVVFLVTCALVYRLMLGLTRDRALAAGSTGFFAFSVAHYSHLNWIAAFTVTCATFCVVASVLCFTRGRVIPCLLWFVVGLLSYETVVVLPLLVLVYEWILKQVCLTRAIRTTWPLWATLGLYAFARIALIGLQTVGDYRVVWSPLTWLNLAIASIVWAVVDRVTVAPALTGPVFNVLTSGPLWTSLTVIAIGGFIGIGLVVVIAFGLDLARRGLRDRQEPMRLIGTGIVWFFVGLLPTLPFANVFSIYALSVPLLGAPLVVAGLARGLQTRYSPRLVTSAMLVWAMSLFAVTWVLIYGPGGLDEVEGTNQLGDAAQTVYLQVVAEETINPGPLDIAVVSSREGEQVAAVILAGDAAADLVAPGSEVHYSEPNGQEDLVFRFDPTSISFTLVSPNPDG
jgi:hypothetical protein